MNVLDIDKVNDVIQFSRLDNNINHKAREHKMQSRLNGEVQAFGFDMRGLRCTWNIQVESRSSSVYRFRLQA